MLHADPGKVLTWDEFQASKPPYSMALDGYVSGQTMYTANGPYANFNHHEAVNRMATRSTCMQIFFSMQLGLFEAFQRKGKPYAHVYVNDADQDVCLSYWLLKNQEKALSTTWNDPLARFLIYEDLIDASAGAYPFNDASAPDSLLKRQAWVFEPYTRARSECRLHTMDGDDIISLIEEICDRISLFGQSKGGTVDLDTIPEVIGGGNDWKLIVDSSIYARTSVYASGTKAFVAMRTRNDGNFTYVIGKMSPFVPFPLLEIYKALNSAEGIQSVDDAWGGSDIIGGSPRKSGSKLSPRELEAIINRIL